jgi:transposase InsO family protein
MSSSKDHATETLYPTGETCGNTRIRAECPKDSWFLSPPMRGKRIEAWRIDYTEAVHSIAPQRGASVHPLSTSAQNARDMHLPRLAGHGSAPRMKNGPALFGHGAEAVRGAIARTILTLPEQLRRSLTWDQGAETAQHARLKIDAGVQVYFCDPQRPWQRGTNENTNGLLRQYFPKGTDLSVHSAQEIVAVAAALNARPRKTLNWRTPAEALDQWLP